VATTLRARDRLADAVRLHRLNTESRRTPPSPSVRRRPRCWRPATPPPRSRAWRRC
jgi:hypothetical protein